MHRFILNDNPRNYSFKKVHFEDCEWVYLIDVAFQLGTFPNLQAAYQYAETIRPRVIRCQHCVDRAIQEDN